MKLEKTLLHSLNSKQINELISVFNKSFGTNTALILREEKLWRWRYIERPESSEDVVVTANVDGKIVGTVFVTYENLKIGDKIYKFGMIDDVGTIPEYRGKRIGHEMMNYAITLMTEQKCDASALYADPEGVAIKIYLSCGFKDIEYVDVFTYLANTFSLAAQFPYAIPFVPIILMIKKILEWKTKTKTKITNHQSPITNLKIQSFPPPSPTHLPEQNLYGMSLFSEDEIKWKFKSSEYKPINFFIYKNNEVSSISSITIQKCSYLKCPIKCGNLSILLGDDEKTLKIAIQNTIRRANRAGIALLSAIISHKDKMKYSILRECHFIHTAKSVLMVKIINDKELNEDFLRDGMWYINSCSSMGVP